MRIAIVHSQVYVAEGIDKVLSLSNAFEIAFKAAGGLEALKELSSLADKCMPDIIVLPMVLKGTSSQELVSLLKITYPSLRVLILSAATNETVLGHWLVSGVSVMVPCYDYPQEIIDALQTVSEGELYLSKN